MRKNIRIPFIAIISPILKLLYYSIGLTESALEFWRDINESGGGALLIRHKILVLVYIVRPKLQYFLVYFV